MIRLIVALIWIAFPAFATQDGWPALHDVTGVAADDVLNIRSGPGATFAIIGQIEPGAKDVEIIEPSEDFAWGMVNTGEGSGWVSLSYLARQPGQWAGAFPKLAQCFGTEPFWTIRFDRDALTLSTVGEADKIQRPIWRTQSTSRRDRFAFGAGDWTATVHGQSCNDGMSDRSYGLSIDLLLGTGRGTTQLSGCCSLN